MCLPKGYRDAYNKEKMVYYFIKAGNSLTADHFSKPADTVGWERHAHTYAPTHAHTHTQKDNWLHLCLQEC